MRKRSVVFIRHEERDLPSTKGLLLSFPAWKKFQPPWIHLSDTMTKRLLTVPTKVPPPLSLETSLRGDQLCPSCPLFLTPGGTAASAATHPPLVCFHIYSLTHPTILLISTRLPSVTGPTLKSHQSSLLRQEPRHQQDSFCLNGTMAAGPAIVAGLTLRSNPIEEEEGR